MKFPMLLAGLWTVLISVAGAQVATQVVLSEPSTGDGSGYTIDTTGRHQNVNVLSRSTTHNGVTAEATSTTSWDINPAGGYIQVSSTSVYSGWNGSGVTLDSRYALGNFDSFTVNAGSSGLSAGAAVKINLAVALEASASTQGDKFQTASNFLNFTVQHRTAPGNGASTELLKMDFDVTVYEFVEKAVINGVTQFDNTVTYVNGNGAEAEAYAFNIEIDAIIGDTIELGLLVGDFNPNVYNYDIANLVSGTRQTIGNSKENYQDQFAALFSWDIEHVAGFEGLDVTAASGFSPSASAVPEPSSSGVLVGLVVFGLVAQRRRRRAA